MKALSLPGGDLEYAVFRAVAELGPSSVHAVHQRVDSSLAYTTVAKVLDRLCAKKLLTRKRDGRSFAYSVRVDRSEVETTRARVLMRKVLGDAPRPALAALVQAVEDVDPKLIDELAEAVAAKRRKRDGP